MFYRILPDQTALAVSLKNQDVDVAFGFNIQDFEDIQESEQMKKLFNFFTPEGFRFYFLYLNRQSPLLNDKRVRRALAHLTDVNAIIENLYNGKATAQLGPISPLAPYFNKDLKPIEYDIEKAKSLLQAVGWEDSDGNGILDKEIDGERVEFKLRTLVSETKFSKDLNAYLTSAFKEAGILLESDNLDFNTLRKKLNQRDFDIASSALPSGTTPIDYFPAYHTSADTPTGYNRAGFGNAESDKIMEEIQVTLTDEGRLPLYLRLQEIIYEDQPKIYLFAPKGKVAISKRLKGQGFGYKPFVYAAALQFEEVE